jgi:GalNAc-alpha-(1->4)-GalNAc-alpha-(1->3)-diNAcBac-PP-undecaprenol alpha-1,4-N-acetyl-D-galactosaminyltransferase
VIAMLVSRLAGRGHDVSLVTLDEGKDDRHDVDDRVRRIRLGVMQPSHNAVDRLINTSKRLLAIRRTIKQLSPDIVLSFCDQTNISVLAATRGMAVPVVVSERSDPSQQRLGRVWEWARRFNYPRAAKTVALTDSAKTYLMPMCPGGVVVIASAVQAPPLISNRSIASQSKQAIAIGRLAPEKGFDRLVEAFAKATSSNPEWNLVILGEGNERARLEQLIKKHALSDRVRLPGWVRPVWTELAKSTFFVLPSYYEGFPSALLEAMAIGVPSLAVDCESGPRAIIDCGKNGVPPNGLLVANDTQALADGIARMISDVEMREQLGRQGTNIVEKFGWDQMVDRYEQVLAEASATRS